MRFMRGIGDLLDVVTAPFRAGADVATSVVTRVPGYNAVASAVDAVVTGPVRDFAKTAVGHAVLFAAAQTMVGGLAVRLGPQLATIAWALPGMAAGQDFATAWSQQASKVFQQTADIVSPEAAQLLATQTQAATDFLAAQAGGAAGYTIQSLANAAHVPDRAAALALDGYGVAIDWATLSFNPYTQNLTAPGRGVSAVSYARQYSTASQDARDSELSAAARLGPLHEFSAYRSTPNPPVQVQSTYGVTAPSPNKSSGDMLLAGTVIAAGAALWYFYRPKR